MVSKKGVSIEKHSPEWNGTRFGCQVEFHPPSITYILQAMTAHSERSEGNATHLKDRFATKNQQFGTNTRHLRRKEGRKDPKQPLDREER